MNRQSKYNSYSLLLDKNVCVIGIVEVSAIVQNLPKPFTKERVSKVTLFSRGWERANLSFVPLIFLLFFTFLLPQLTQAQTDSTTQDLPLPDSVMQKTSDSTVLIAPFPNENAEDSTQNVVSDTTQTASDSTGSAAALLQEEPPPKINTDSIEYAANSVWKLYEEDLYLNTKREVHPDTSVHLLHRYNIIQRSDYTYQNLGNMGTASQSIFYKNPKQLGNRWGITAYEPYIRRPEEIPYFNTLAPYVDIFLVQGGQGKSWLDVDLSRNVNPDWNVSIFYRRLSSNKVTNRAFRRNDELVEHQTFSFTNRFFSKNHRYKLLAHFSWYDHNVLEFGGVESSLGLEEEFPNQALVDTLYQLDNSQLRYRLPSFGSVNQFGRTFHVYHQYSLTKAGQLEVFHRANYSQNTNAYSDPAESFGANLAFYQNFSAFPVVEENLGFTYRTYFSQLENKAGIKGRINDFQYRTFVKFRSYQKQYDFPFSGGQIDANNEIELEPELFVGGGLRYFFNTKSEEEEDIIQENYEKLEKEQSQLDSPSSETDSLATKPKLDISIKEYSVGSVISYLDASGEYQISSDVLGDYRFSAEWVRNNLSVGYERLNYSPALVEQYSFQPHLIWINENLNRTTSDKVYASFRLNPMKLLKKSDSLYKISLRPYVSASNIQNLIYYDTSSVVRQSALATQPISVGLATKASYKKWNVLLDVRYNQNLGEDLVRMPPLFVNLLAYYKSKLFGNAMEAEIGTDFHFHSRYKADAYNPLLQQFHLQDRYQVGGFPQLDVFFNFKVSRARITMKLNNALLDVFAEGYYDTPLYIAQPRAFEVVINWLFFN